MRIIAPMFLAVSVLAGTVACTGGQVELQTQPPSSGPTPDLAATVEASVRGTQEVEAAIDATVQAEVAAILTAPLPTATLYPTAIPWPTATPYPTATPLPTPSPITLRAR